MRDILRNLRLAGTGMLSTGLRKLKNL